MKHFKTIATASLALAGFALQITQVQAAGATVAANVPMVYPAKGQSAQQTERDKFECYEWSKGQTGFDPLQAEVPQAMVQPGVATASTSQSTAPSHAALGMAKRAAGGAAVAELTHNDAGKGAAVGVLGAAVRERMQQQQAAQAKQQQATQQQAQQQQLAQQQAVRAQQRAGFERGFAACMEARGFVVK
jgi:type II secretory pathway pseudopilin PulG